MEKVELSLINQGKWCHMCKKETELVDSKVVYGVSYGMIYLCKCCGSYVGTHSDGITSKGSIANKELRELRKQAHAAFDKIWKEGLLPRSNAYAWLSRTMNIDRDLTHIGMFKMRQCKECIEVSKEFYKTHTQGIKSL